ncbi:MAG: hypothetical protein ACR2PH_09655 [Desulfobulbia bacterium]
MKVYFECVGFESTQVYVENKNSDKSPVPYGSITVSLGVEEFHKHIMHYHENEVANISQEEIIQAYIEQCEKHGVVVNDVSKEAWLEGRYGEPVVTKTVSVEITNDEIESLRLLCDWWYKTASPNEAGGDQSVCDHGYGLIEKLNA